MFSSHRLLAVAALAVSALLVPSWAESGLKEAGYQGPLVDKPAESLTAAEKYRAECLRLVGRNYNRLVAQSRDILVPSVVLVRLKVDAQGNLVGNEIVSQTNPESPLGKLALDAISRASAQFKPFEGTLREGKKEVFVKEVAFAYGMPVTNRILPAGMLADSAD